MKLTYVESVGIKKLEQHEKTVEFVDVPDAEQYRVSMKMKSTRKQAS